MGKKPGIFFSIFIFLIACIAGCANQEERGGYQEVKTETEQLPDMAQAVDTTDMLGYAYLGSQFYQGERVQLWGERKQEGGSVYLHREDGSRELLMEKVHSYFLNDRWWIDEDSRVYVIKNQEIIRPDMDKALMADSGFQVYEGIVSRYEAEQNEVVMDICQLKDGRVIVLLNKAPSSELAELDPDSGRVKVIQNISGSGPAPLMVAADEDKVLLLANDGIWDCDLADGKMNSLLSFNGTSYTLKQDNQNVESYLAKEDFRLLEDGRVELLWSDGTVEYLSLEQVNEERQAVVLRMCFPSSWMKEQVVKFNLENEAYYITIEEAGDADW